MYIMKIGEKIRKNLALVMLLTVMMTTPAIPNPMSSSLNAIVVTLRGC
jgi:formate hydrogenlyase subunit 4